jgi:two-component system chemotaxis response regulator CheB
VNPPPQPEFPVVIGVGASAGGVEALIGLVGALPLDLPAPVLVVLHVAPSSASVLAGILGRQTGMPVTAARGGERMQAGHLYVAPPDQHLRAVDGVLTLDREPRVNGHRPAIDPLLRSLADAYGPRAVGVILSGTRDDGTMGLAAVKSAGGLAFVQDPDEALYPSMPLSAADAVAVDGSLGVEALAHKLGEIARSAPDADQDGEARSDLAVDRAAVRAATRLTCPDCGGVLFEQSVVGGTRFACSVGHVYAPESLDVEQARHLESALWAAVRSLEDRADLLERLAERAHGRQNERAAGGHRSEAEESLRRADLIRRIVAEPRRTP